MYGTDPDDSIYENQGLYVVPTQTEEAAKQLGVLKERIERMGEEAKIENAAIENLTKKSYVKTWAKRREDVDSGWDTKRETYLTAFIKHKALFKRFIEAYSSYRMRSVKWKCDRETNSLWVARNVMMNYVVLFLYIAVPVPLYVPTDCTECSDKGKIELVSGPTCIAVVNQNGKIF
ncbi:Uncharacterized protein APZ42_015717 [Daphnia magna]|uniref:Uncharacterized protein n=1 Tax=Daphnia magna TaxID=35525 RepID=A0A162NQE6_9CRUS|nr:Uncharacterized protein APZ42_015717 [Daphnia magna]